MNKKLILTSIVTFFTNMMIAQAPAIQWQKSLGGTSYDIPFSMQQTLDGGYIVAGTSRSTNGDVTGNHGSGDYWIVKLDSASNVQWKKSFGGSSEESAYSIQQTSDGGYIIVGYSRSNDGDVTGYHGNGDCWIIKLSNSGTIQWQKSLGGSNVDWGKAVQQTSDGGYIVAGYSRSNDGDVTGNQGSDDYWIVKLNADGTIQWQKSLGNGLNNWASAIQQTSDGGYIVAGESVGNGGDITGYRGGSDYWVVKLNAEGTIQWQKSLGGNDYDMAYAIQQTSDGGYIVAGTAKSNNGDVTGNHGGSDYWIVKLNTMGAIQWQKSLGGSGDDVANSIQQTSDGGYIVAGYSWSDDGDVTGNHGGSDYWIVKLNSFGALQWQKSFGASFTDVANSIRQTSDGGYIIAGKSNSINSDVIGNHGNEDYWIVKLYPENLNIDETSLKNIIFVENPIKDHLKINSKEKITSLQLYNAAGQLVKTANSQNMSVKELSKGIYILKIQLENGKFISEKIVKE